MKILDVNTSNNINIMIQRIPNPDFKITRKGLVKTLVGTEPPRQDTFPGRLKSNGQGTLNSQKI